MNTVETLKAARALIDSPEKWCQGLYEIMGAHGFPVKCCALGSVHRVTDDAATWVSVNSSLHVAAVEIGYSNAVDLNDLTDHATVMRMFDLAIKMAEEA